MTPYALMKIAEAAENEAATGDQQTAIYRMLHALVRHEADKEADRNMNRPRDE